MAFNPFQKAIAHTLVGLNPTDFKRFCSHVQERSKEPTMIRKMDPVELTDFLVSSYNKYCALLLTLQILTKIGCKVEALRLGRFVDERELIRRVRKVEPILDELLTKEVIQQESYDEIKARPTSEEQMRKLFDCLRDAGDRDKDILFNIIEELEPDVIETMFRPAVQEASGYRRKSLKLSRKSASTIARGSRMSLEECAETYSIGDEVEQVSEVTPSRVKLPQPVFSPRGVLMKVGFPVKMNCNVLIYQTNKAFLTLHVYLIPRDPALQETIKNKELSRGSKMIQKPYPEKSLKMRDRFILTADKDGAKINPEKLKLMYESSDPHYFEVFIKNPDSNFQLTLGHGTGSVWTCEIRTDDYLTGDAQMMFDKELDRVRSKLVDKMSTQVIKQLLDDLLKDGVLNSEEKDSILQENSTRSELARCLIDMVKKKGQEASRKLFTHLQKRDPTLCAWLELPSGQPVKPGPSVLVPSPRPKSVSNPWPEKGRFVDERELIRRVRKVEPILDELLSKGVIQQESYDEIKARPTSEEQMRKLFDCLRDAGDRDKDILFNIIEELEPDVIETMFRYARPSRPTAECISKTHLENFAVTSTMAKGSQMSPEDDWIKLEPEVNSVDAPTYRLQSGAGNYECSVSGLRWVCKEKVGFKYQFGSWEEHMERIETMQYMAGGPLMDITVIAGKFEEVYLPHWICTDDNPTILGKFAVLHIDTCGDEVEQVSEVTPSHVKLSQPGFSPRGVLVKVGFPVKINCNVLIYQTSKAFLTLHVYLIPRDPALRKTIKNKELSWGSKMIPKPYPEKSLKMQDRFILTADKDGAKINPEKLKLVYESSGPNFFEVFIKNPDSDFELTLGHETGSVWTSEIRKNDYQNTGDTLMMFDKELDRVRSKLVDKMSTQVIKQLLDDLLTDGVLNSEEKDSILQENSTSSDRARCLIDMVKKKGQEASRKLFTHLQKRDPTLSAELELPSG